MRRRWVCAILASFIISSIAPAQTRTIRIGWENWPPYQYMDETGRLAGLDIETASAILHYAGFKPVFAEMPFARQFNSFRDGSLDLLLSVGKSEERLKAGYFTHSYNYGYNVLFVRKSEAGKHAITGLKDVIRLDFRLGIVRGYEYSDEYTALKADPGFAAKLDETHSEELNIKKLEAGRVDGILCDELTGYYLMRRISDPSLFAVHMRLYGVEQASSFMLASRKTMSPGDVARINAAIDALGKDGAIRGIRKKYTN